MKNIIESRNIFELDAYLAKNINWSKYTLTEIKTIAGIYSTINPEWDDIRDIVFDAKYYRELLNIDRNMSIKEIADVFKSIKSKNHEIWVEPTYNLSEEEIASMPLTNPIEIMKKEEKSIFPKELVVISLIGSVAIVVDQKNPEYEVKASKISIGFDEHIKRHLLFGKNTLKDEDGNIVGGLKQYFSCQLSQIKAFKSVYALRLFLTLFSYNGIEKKFTFENLCDSIGVKMEKPKLKDVKLESNKFRRKYYNFRLRTLKNSIDEINKCTGMGLSYRDEILMRKDGSIDINVVFSIPNYRKDNKIEEVEDKNGDKGDENNEKDGKNIEDKDDNENENLDSLDNYDWDNILKNIFPEESDGLSDDDRKFIDMNVNLLKSTGNELEYNVIKDIYLESNKDKNLTTKKLMKLIKK